MVLAKFKQKFLKKVPRAPQLFLPKCKIRVSQAQRDVLFYSLPTLNLRLKLVQLDCLSALSC